MRAVFGFSSCLDSYSAIPDKASQERNPGDPWHSNWPENSSSILQWQSLTIAQMHRNSGMLPYRKAAAPLLSKGSKPKPTECPLV